MLEPADTSSNSSRVNSLEVRNDTFIRLTDYPFHLQLLNWWHEAFESNELAGLSRRPTQIHASDQQQILGKDQSPVDPIWWKRRSVGTYKCIRQVRKSVCSAHGDRRQRIIFQQFLYSFAADGSLFDMDKISSLGDSPLSIFVISAQFRFSLSHVLFHAHMFHLGLCHQTSRARTETPLSYRS